MKPFTILLVKSRGWWETKLFGYYKDAGMMVKMTNMAGRETNMVFCRSNGSWVIKNDLNHWKKSKLIDELEVEYLQSKEKSHDDFMEVLGRNKLNPWQAFAKIFGIPNFMKATPQTLLNHKFLAKK